MSHLSLSFLGTCQVILDDRPITTFRSAKVQGLLVYLVLEADRPHPRDVLAALFWPEEPDTVARKNLNQSLYQLRKVLGPPEESYLLVTRASMQFNDQSDHYLDVTDFQQQRQRNQLAAAAEVYRGELLPGFTCDSESFEDWLRLRREELHRQALAVLGDATEQALAAADYETAQVYARRQIKWEPWREEAHRQLMTALNRAGEQGAALSQYERCCQILAEELGLEPDPETKTLYEAIRFGTQAGRRPVRKGQSHRPPGPNPVQIGPQAPLPDLYTTLSRLEPLPNQKLFGLEAVHKNLEQALQREDRPWLLAIDGMGGLGKTALANAIAHHFVASSRFYDLAWVSAKQAAFTHDGGLPKTAPPSIVGPALDSPALVDMLLEQLLPEIDLSQSSREKRTTLTTLLKQHPYLVIIDNLETVADYQALLPFLRLLSNPSKFLLTSRFTLHQFSDVFSVSLNELNQADTLDFLRHEAETRNIRALVQATDAQLNQIYDLVGGNPLALKLIMGQVGFSPLSRILRGLTRRREAQMSELYSYLYQQGWQMLDEIARQVLITLLTNPKGSFSQLQAITALSESSLQQALVYLTNLSFVNAGGNLDQPRYHLHRLTETFLLQEIVVWQIAESGGMAGERPAPTEAGAALSPEQPPPDWPTYFQKTVQDTLIYWQVHEAIHMTDVTRLDQEREGILQALFFGLYIPSAWPTVRDLAIVFTSYMERRGHWDAWNRFLLQAIEYAQSGHDRAGLLTLTALLARLYQRQNQPQQVIYYYRRAISLAREMENDYELARAYSNLGYLYSEQGRWQRSEVLCCRALAIFDNLASAHGQAHTHNHLGVLYTRRRQWQLAEQHLEQAGALWQRMGDGHGLLNGLSNLGLLYLKMKEPARALACLDQARQQASLTGEMAYLGPILLNMGASYSLQGDLAKAEGYLKQAEAIYRQFGQQLGLARAWHELGVIYTRQEKWSEALAYLAQSRTTFQTLNDQPGELAVLMDLIEADISQGQMGQATTHLHELEQFIDHYKQKISFERAQRYLEEKYQVVYAT